MADLWQQFHLLPKAIRDGVATPVTIAAVDDLEQKYPGLELADVIMRVVVRELPISGLAAKLTSENSSLDLAAANDIVTRLRQDVFTGVTADYLGLTKDVPETKTVPVKPAATPINLPIQVSTSTPVSVRPVSSTILFTPPPRSPAPVNRPSILPPASPVPRPVVSAPPATLIPKSFPTQPAAPIGSQAPTTQYSDDDTAEIANQTSKLRILTNSNPNQDLDSLARQILTEHNLAYGDELLDKRSLSIIKAQLKNVRAQDETVALCERDPKLGGLGLDREIAIAIAATTAKYGVTLKERGMVQPIAPPIPPPPPPAVPPMTQTKPAPIPPLHHDAPNITTSVPVRSVTDAPRPSRPIVRPIDIPNLAPLPAPAKVIPDLPISPAPSTAVQSSPTPIIQRPRMSDRQTVADVVRPQVALGPAEEIRSMTLIEFRRLGQGAAESAGKLLDKFSHLQRESFTVWAEAVAGWRQSAVYQLYLTMGRESLEKGFPISEIIAERGRTGQPYLSDHEFAVLSDLNRQLQL